MTPVDAYIAVGSNVSPHEHILRALDLLRARVAIRGISTFYRTRALNRPEQPDYRNGIFWVQTTMAPKSLKFEVLRPAELALGRVRCQDPYAPRTIDLDLILYGDEVVRTEELTLPDPEIRTRPFVAVPLWELAPALRLPDTRQPLAEIVTPAMRQGMEPDVALTNLLRERISHESATR